MARRDADPEHLRLNELATAVREGRASEAEREELRMYAHGSEEARALVRRVEQDAALGGSWLARSEADHRLAAVEKTPFTLAERSVGVGLVAAGVIGSFFFPPAALAILAGGLVLGISVLRVKAKTIGQDPYSNIDK